MSSAASSRHILKNYHKTIRAVFPVYKEKGVELPELSREIELKVDNDLGKSLFAHGFKLVSAGVIEKFASGIVIFTIGRHTEMAKWLRVGERWYNVEVKLGESRMSYIEDTEVTGVADSGHVSKEAIAESLLKFRGTIVQERPPFAGWTLKENRPPLPPPLVPITRPTVVHSITLTDFKPPFVKLLVHCGACFNPRQFAHDFGKGLGTLSYATAIHRYQQGPFPEALAIPSYAITWDRIKKVSGEHSPIWTAYVRKTREEMKDDIAMFEGKAVYR